MQLNQSCFFQSKKYRFEKNCLMPNMCDKKQKTAFFFRQVKMPNRCNLYQNVPPFFWCYKRRKIVSFTVSNLYKHMNSQLIVSCSCMSNICSRIQTGRSRVEVKKILTVNQKCFWEFQNFKTTLLTTLELFALGLGFE